MPSISYLVLRALDEVQSLDVQNCISLKGLSVIECYFFHTITGFDKLKKLQFFGITDNDRFDFSTCGDDTNLKEVSFLGCKEFNDLRDIKDLKQLEVLDLAETAVHELDLLIEFPLLKQLSIIWCHGLKDLDPLYIHILRYLL